MGIDISEIKDYLDHFSRQLEDINSLGLDLGHIEEQLEEIKALLEKILGKIK